MENEEHFFNCLSVSQRKIIGEWCRDNNIGFHKSTKKQRKEWALMGLASQKESGSKDTFYYWSTEEGRKERASLGGKKGGVSTTINKIGIHKEENRRQYASLGGKSHIGKIWIHKDEKRTRIYPNEFSEYEKNGWYRGLKKT